MPNIKNGMIRRKTRRKTKTKTKQNKDMLEDKLMMNALNLNDSTDREHFPSVSLGVLFHLTVIVLIAP